MATAATPRHPNLLVTVAPFRAWRGSQGIVAKGPLWPLTGGERGIRTLGTPFGRTPAFQASPFSHSGTSPTLNAIGCHITFSEPGVTPRKL